jgi:PAS domain S-box-containing protein
LSADAAPLPELFTHLSRLLREPLLLVSVEGTLLGSNASARTLLGREGAALHGQPLGSLTEETSQQGVADFLHRCARSLQPLPGALMLRLASGELVRRGCQGARLSPADTCVLLRFPDEPAHKLAFGLLNQKVEELTREVTRRRQTEERLAQGELLLRTIIDTLPVGVWIVDGEGNGVSGNAACRRIWGEARMLGPGRYHEYEAWFADTGQRLGADDWGVSRALKDGEMTLGKLLRIRTFDGQDKLILYSSVPLRNAEGRIIGAVAVNEDVTGWKQAEEELRRAMELQEQLVGIVGHDVRSPLSVVMMSTRQLQQFELDERPRKAVDRIDRAGRRIEQVVRLLLDFTHARGGKGIPVHVRPLSLRELCTRVVDEMRAAHPHRAVELHGSPAWGEGDPDRLFQVLANLVENAFKYGAPDRPVTLTTREVDDEVRVEVHNEGPPISEALLPRLFEPFSRGAQTDETVKLSLGLGLYIVREIVRVHRGTVEVRSTHETGTTFTVRLPRRYTSLIEDASILVASG